MAQPAPGFITVEKECGYPVLSGGHITGEEAWERFVRVTNSFSSLSSAIVQFAIVWWITIETGSSKTLAYASIAAFLPQAALSPFIGVFIDRWSKKKILVASDLFIAFVSSLLGILYYFQVVEMWHIYLILALRSVGNAFYFPALQASIPLLAPQDQFMRIAAINQMIQGGANTLGPALGAFAVMAFTMPVILMFDVLGACIASLLLAFTKIPVLPLARHSVGNVLCELREGVAVLVENRGMAILICISALFYLVFMPLNSLYPLLIFNHFRGGVPEMGIIEFVVGVCMILGGVTLGVWNIPVKKVVLINISYLGMGFSLILSGLLSPSGFVPFVFLFGLFGFFVPAQNNPLTALVQTHIDPSKLGRVFALIGALHALPALSLLGMGYIADSIGIPYTFTFSGFLVVVLGVVGFFIPPVMKMRDRK